MGIIQTKDYRKSVVRQSIFKEVEPVQSIIKRAVYKIQGGRPVSCKDNTPEMIAFKMKKILNKLGSTKDEISLQKRSINKPKLMSVE